MPSSHRRYNPNSEPAYRNARRAAYSELRNTLGEGFVRDAFPDMASAVSTDYHDDEEVDNNVYQCEQSAPVRSTLDLRLGHWHAGTVVRGAGKFVGYFLLVLAGVCLVPLWFAACLLFYLVVFGGGFFGGLFTMVWLSALGVAGVWGFLAALVAAVFFYYCVGVVNHYTDFIEKTYEFLHL